MFCWHSFSDSNLLAVWVCFTGFWGPVIFRVKEHPLLQWPRTLKLQLKSVEMWCRLANMNGGPISLPKLSHGSSRFSSRWLPWYCWPYGFVMFIPKPMWSPSLWCPLQQLPILPRLQGWVMQWLLGARCTAVQKRKIGCFFFVEKSGLNPKKHPVQRVFAYSCFSLLVAGLVDSGISRCPSSATLIGLQQRLWCFLSCAWSGGQRYLVFEDGVPKLLMKWPVFF